MARDQVRVLPGELIPVDGRVLEGRAFIRETSFTGEWIPQRRGPDDTVIAGTVCEDGSLRLQVRDAAGHRRFDDLAQLIERARQSPTSLQRQADHFVAWFLPSVLTVALLTGLFWTWQSGLRIALMNSLAVLLVACPCAAGLATPLVLWSVIGQLAKRGLVVRSGETIEQLATVDSVIFDKTGTLGDDRLSIEAIELPDDVHERRTTLAIIAALEHHSNHPVARALRELKPGVDTPGVSVSWCRALPGRGIVGEVRLSESEHKSAQSVHRVRIERDDCSTSDGHPIIQVTVDDQRVARIVIREKLRETATDAVRQLEALRCNVRIMTGDGWAGARQVRDLAPTSASMSPEAKHRAVVKLRGCDENYARPLFVGDGLNDAAAMAVAHTSIALASGSDVAVEAAAATLHGEDLRLVPDSVQLARRAVWAVRTNFYWAASYNLVGITLAATGWLNPIVAAVLMAASSVLVSWRSFRVTGGLPSESWQRWGSGTRAVASRSDSAQVNSPAVRTGFGSRSVTVKKALHALGMAGQALLLIIIARLGMTSSLAIVVTLMLLTWAAIRWWHFMPAWLDMTFAMVTLGGFGMNLGWWADLGFQDGVVVSCQSPSVACSPEATCDHAVEGTSQEMALDPAGATNSCHAGRQRSSCHCMEFASWMNLGMLALGVPAMFWARFQYVPWSWRRWCCTGMLLSGVPGMVLGMMAGSILSMWLFPHTDPSTMVVLHYVFMMVGMCVGMLLPHMVESLAEKPATDSSQEFSRREHTSVGVTDGREPPR